MASHNKKYDQTTANVIIALRDRAGNIHELEDRYLRDKLDSEIAIRTQLMATLTTEFGSINSNISNIQSKMQDYFVFLGTFTTSGQAEDAAKTISNLNLNHSTILLYMAETNKIGIIYNFLRNDGFVQVLEYKGSKYFRYLKWNNDKTTLTLQNSFDGVSITAGWNDYTAKPFFEIGNKNSGSPSLNIYPLHAGGIISYDIATFINLVDKYSLYNENGSTKFTAEEIQDWAMPSSPTLLNIIKNLYEKNSAYQSVLQSTIASLLETNINITRLSGQTIGLLCGTWGLEPTETNTITQTATVAQTTSAQTTTVTQTTSAQTTTVTQIHTSTQTQINPLSYIIYSGINHDDIDIDGDNLTVQKYYYEAKNNLDNLDISIYQDISEYYDVTTQLYYPIHYIGFDEGPNIFIEYAIIGLGVTHTQQTTAQTTTVTQIHTSTQTQINPLSYIIYTDNNYNEGEVYINNDDNTLKVAKELYEENHNLGNIDISIYQNISTYYDVNNELLYPIRYIDLDDNVYTRIRYEITGQGIPKTTNTQIASIS